MPDERSVVVENRRMTNWAGSRNIPLCSRQRGRAGAIIKSGRPNSAVVNRHARPPDLDRVAMLLSGKAVAVADDMRWSRAD
jgi:hypothetical protein